MDNVLMWAALAFAAGTIFGMTTAASMLSGRAIGQQPTVVVMDQHRPETLAEAGNGCAGLILMLLLGVGVVAALIVLLGS